VWYEIDRPTTSMNFQVYDLARGEYDAVAIERWLDLVLSKHPNHGAYVRDLRTEGLPGATEADRLARAIEREKVRWANVQRESARSYSRAMSGLGPSSYRGGNLGRPMSDRPSRVPPLGPLRPPASPFPYPYRMGPR